jgi:hypothetical protein
MPGSGSACSVHRTENHSPAQQQNSERDGGYEDKGRRGSATGGQPQQHADDDCAQPNHCAGSEAGGVAPGPGDDVTREAAGEEWPSGAEYTEKVIILTVVTPTDYGEGQ